MTKIFKLTNNLTLVLNEMQSTRSVATGIFVSCGSDYEEEREAGISHFIEHMLFKGTEKRTAFDIACEAEAIGAQMNAFTARQMTCFYTVSTSEHAAECMDILSDIFFNSTFPAEELEREKGVVIEEIHRSLDDPEDVCFDKLSFAIYGNQSKGRPILGSEETVRSFDADKLREYMARHYSAASTVVSVAGNISEEEAVKLVEEKFARMFAERGESAVLPAAVRKYSSVVTEKPTEQAVIAFAFDGYPYSDKRSVALKIAAGIFGGGMSSRLFQSVREKKGLAYEVYSVSGAGKDGGVFEIFLGTNPDGAEEAVRTIGKEWRLLVEKGVGAEELKRAKEQSKTAMVLGAESASSVMRSAGRAMILGEEAFDIDKALSEVEAVTEEDILSVVRECLSPQKLAASYVGKKLSKDIKELLSEARRDNENQ